ncbi:hypothetical protein NML20_13600 [Escherichia coli]|nr:hypothetical protein [Escherichia coli]UTO97190.1 hypothetical protein NML20_13600 [Escherichia coli]
MTSLKTSIKTITYLSDTGCLEIQGASLVGASWQKHYGTDVVTQLGYGQRISWNDVIDAGATLRWEKRPYDGDREHNLYVEFDMTFRF